MKKIVIAILSFFICTVTSAQIISVREYIETYKEVAILEMKRVGIPASITLAQGILETENGNSDLVKRSNNHFGIKCKNSWTGATVFHDDDAAGECFRKYDKATDSYKDHSDFLRGSSRYAFLFDLDPADYKSWAYGLKKAGYATNPRYPEILIKHIEQYNLGQYDQPGELATVPVVPESIVEEKKPVEIAASNEMNTSKNLASIKAGRTLFNGLKAVFVSKGTSLLAIATEFDIPLSKLLEYNDLRSDGILKEEQWIFLEKKLKQGNRDYYTTVRGETLYGISQTNAIQLNSLLLFNNMNENEVIKTGMKIRLRPATVKQEATGNARNTILHLVKPKEGLYAISKKYNVSVQELKILNNLTADDLKEGQQLIISK
jgi:LysM repeat protein